MVPLEHIVFSTSLSNPLQTLHSESLAHKQKPKYRINGCGTNQYVTWYVKHEGTITLKFSKTSAHSKRAWLI